MYKLHLILKYLRKRRIAWVSLVAVCLCTTMVLVVMSVMGGWLRMFRTSFHGLSGDVIIQGGSLSGFPYYEEMIERVQQLPEVEAAVPTLQTFGLININMRKTMGVQVIGYPIDRIGRVNNFPKSLWRQYNQWAEWADGAPMLPEDRQRLRTVDKLTQVRDGEELLRLTPEEMQALKDALPKARALLDKAKTKAETGIDSAGGAAERVEEARWLVERVKLLTDPRGGGVAVAYPDERKEIRRLLGNVIDDPDKRLAPNDAERQLARERATRAVGNPSFDLFLPPEEYKAAFRRANPKAKPAIVEESATWTGIITGTGVVNIRKDKQGKLQGREEFLYRIPVALTVMGVSATGNFDVQNRAERNYWIVDTSRTKVWQYDSNTVYVPFEVLQKDLGMEEKTAEFDGKPVRIPARTAEVHIRVLGPDALERKLADLQKQRQSVARDSAEAKGLDAKIERVRALLEAGDSRRLVMTRNAVQLLVDQTLSEKKDVALRNILPPEFPRVRTWEESQAKWLGAIEKEMVLVTGLFGIISVVAVFLIFCIFYMIVVEKTRDIGIIKSVGATSSGVAGIFLGYGAAIGIVGAGLGLLLGYLIVHNINELHGWLGKAMGVQIWDPEVYAFDTIPNTMDPPKVVWILAIAVIASVLGALVPAIRAARLNPVEALRWE